MSKEIDWSKAPEGATHYAPKREENCMWRAVFWRIEDGRGVEAWSVNEDGSLQYYEKPTWIGSDIGRLIERPKLEWNGTGLPPVGTVCECQDSNLNWNRGAIVYIGKDGGNKLAVMQCDNEILCGELGEFRPIRTHEQIAAEGREKAVSEMLEKFKFGEDKQEMLRAVCFGLYDAGYRKTEAGK